MNAKATWTDDLPGAPAPPLPASAPASAAPSAAAPSAAPSARAKRTVDQSKLTVLPRLEEAPQADASGGRPKLVGDVRQRFEPLGEIGEGGLGTVLAARDLDIGRRVAIKKIRADRQSQGAFLRFVQEVRTVGRLDHPNIVPIHDVGRDDEGAYYFVMKYVDGEPLEDVIERLKAGDPATLARWGFEQRVQLFLQVLHAVEFAHSLGIVHRDLKPANVMVGRHGEVQLLDWGVAKALDQAELPREEGAEPVGRLAVTKTRAGQLVGTPRYMAPEQARGEPVDVRADTWALSLLFLELLFLSHPLDGLDSLDAVLDRLKAWSPPAPYAFRNGQPKQGPVPGELGWYVLQGLQAAPADRYQTVAAMIDRLERRNEGDFPIQCPVTLQKRALTVTRRAIDRRPFVMLGLAGFALASMAALALTTVAALSTAALAVLGAVALT